MSMKQEIINIGHRVYCDLCNKEYGPDSNDKGGLLFGSKAVCPLCKSRVEEDLKKYNEEEYIRRRCPEDMTFYHWVVEVLREGREGTITITSL